MIQEPDYTFNLLLLGNSTVGKTSLIYRFAHQRPWENPSTTIGFSFESRVVDIDGKKIKLLLNDTAGQERFKSIARTFYKNSDAIVLVYDIVDKKSLKDLNKWLVDVENNTFKDIPKMLLGNKCDRLLEREVSYTDGSNLAQYIKIPFFQTSAIEGNNVQQVFLKLATILKERKEKNNILKDSKSSEIIKIQAKQCQKSTIARKWLCC